jgi:hypothetical protein
MLLVFGLTMTVAAMLPFIPRIPQDPAYHQFADRRAFLGLPLFMNVISNLPIALAGLWGIAILLKRTMPSRVGAVFATPAERWPYLLFSLGSLGIGIGSGYYHLAPDNARLVWDRLPMTLAIMALVAAAITERIGVRSGLAALPALILLGMGSVVYWYRTEQRGIGDLRPYAAIQYYPAVLIPVLLALFPSRYTRGCDWLAALGWYAAAKGFEFLDRPILAVGNVVSGHTLKHLAAAVAIYWILRMLVKRQPRQVLL